MEKANPVKPKDEHPYVRPKVTYLFPETANDVVATVAVGAAVAAVVTKKVKSISPSDHFVSTSSKLHKAMGE